MSALVQIDSAYFSEALETPRSLKSESGRASILSELAKQNSAYFSEALETARSVQSESNRTDVLSELAKNAPPNLLPEIYQTITQITHLPTRAQALSGYLARIPLANLPSPDWQSHLHLLAHRKRSELMEDLVTLYPAIIALGGEGAMRGVVDEMKRVCGQWR